MTAKRYGGGGSRRGESKPRRNIEKRRQIKRKEGIDVSGLEKVLRERGSLRCRAGSWRHGIELWYLDVGLLGGERGRATVW